VAGAPLSGVTQMPPDLEFVAEGANPSWVWLTATTIIAGAGLAAFTLWYRADSRECTLEEIPWNPQDTIINPIGVVQETNCAVAQIQAGCRQFPTPDELLYFAEKFEAPPIPRDPISPFISEGVQTASHPDACVESSADIQHGFSLEGSICGIRSALDQGFLGSEQHLLGVFGDQVHRS